MPFTFSVTEYADMIYVYGFCDGNSVHAVAEYQQLFRTVEYQTGECLHEFTKHCEIPVNLPAFALQPRVLLMKASMKKKSSPRASTRRIARRLRVPHTRVWRTLHADGIHTTCSECNISELAILLRPWNFASGSMAVASCMLHPVY